ncbi:MAG: DNA-binding protein [Clostridiales bacterium]|nr:DNA-binding protein [Clostridiales bacterium]
MKDLSILALSDLYGRALTEKQREILADYYERDFSLSEIAENYGISRQGVYAALSTAEASVKDYEAKFGFYAFLHALNEKLTALKVTGSDVASGVEDILEWIRSNYGTV